MRVRRREGLWGCPRETHTCQGGGIPAWALCYYVLSPAHFHGTFFPTDINTTCQFVCVQQNNLAQLILLWHLRFYCSELVFTLLLCSAERRGGGRVLLQLDSVPLFTSLLSGAVALWASPCSGCPKRVPWLCHPLPCRWGFLHRYKVSRCGRFAILYFYLITYFYSSSYKSNYPSVMLHDSTAALIFFFFFSCSKILAALALPSLGLGEPGPLPAGLPMALDPGCTTRSSSALRFQLEIVVTAKGQKLTLGNS